MISKQITLETVRYGIAGLINTVVGLLLYLTCVKFLSTPFWIANIAAILGGLICGYFLSRKFVFTSSDEGLKRAAPRYVFVIGLQFIVTTAIIGCLIATGQDALTAYFLTLPIAIMLSFGLQKLWVFKTTTLGVEV